MEDAIPVQPRDWGANHRDLIPNRRGLLFGDGAGIWLTQNILWLAQHYCAGADRLIFSCSTCV
jgi:hypothetical protein